LPARPIEANLELCGFRRYPACSHKIEFSRVNGNLMVSASPLPIFNWDSFREMEEQMFVESAQGSMTEVLLFMAIIGLTLVSTIDLLLHTIKQEKKADREH
jgi:hypothetical protein